VKQNKPLKYVIGAFALVSALAVWVPQVAASSVVWFISPLNGQTVSGSITVMVGISSKPANGPNSVASTRLEVDGTVVAIGYNELSWNTTTVANGTHQLRVDAFSRSTTPLGYSIINVNVDNPVATPAPTPTLDPPKATATPTPKPTPTTSPKPTATPAAAPTSVLWFLSPLNGQTVSGSITVVLDIPSTPSATDPTSVWWTRLEVDGTAVVSGYNNLPWNTATVANGTHQLRVDGFAYGSSTSLGYSIINVNVNNSGATPTPTPKSTPTPAPSPTPSPKPTATPVGPTPTATATSTGLSLSVSGSRLVNGSGQTVTLHGVDMGTAAFSCLNGWGTFNQPHTSTTISALQAWNVNFVWIGLNEDCWLGINGEPTGESAAQYRSDILAWSRSLEAAGIYVLLDLQWVAPGTYVSNAEQPLPDKDHAPSFWASVAATFANEKGVAFNLLDEPTCYLATQVGGTACNWNVWLNGGSNVTCRQGSCNAVPYTPVGMNSLISTIRAAEGSGWHHVIMAPTLGFTLSLATWPSYAPSDSAHQLIAGSSAWGGNTGNDCAWTDTTCMANDIGAPVRAGYPVVIYGQGGTPWSTANPIFLNWTQANISGESAWSWENEGDGYALTSDGNGTATVYGASYKLWLLGLP